MTTHHAPRPLRRVCDVAVVGGSAAGLAAALQLGRQRRGVLVIDSGEPRNAAAAHLHGFLGHEAVPPAELLGRAREEVRSYGVEVLAGHVSGARRAADRFHLELTGGHTVVARRVLVATGITDVLPDVDSLAGHWGGDVVHCPFCHGYEVRDRRVVQIVTHPAGLHPTPLFRRLTDDLTVVVHPGAGADADALGRISASGVTVVEAAVRRLVDGPDGRIAAVELADGRRLPADAVAVGPRFRARTEVFAGLGLTTTPHPSGLGDTVATDPAGATSVPGVYAAGNVTDPSQQLMAAAAHGSWVGAMIALGLADEELDTADRPSANAADWDTRYSGEPVWSGNPNGTLVAEVIGRPPGRALDVGAGEGGDAVWLAEQGWRVTASDVSARALERVAAAAGDRGLTVECLLADANDPAPYPPEGFDLVSLQYASIPRTPDQRAITNVLAAVAPGGTLLVVGHDLAPMQVPIDTREHSRAHDPDAYVRVDDVAAVLADRPGWTVEVHERRPRPPGAASTHHVDDVVLRARRHGDPVAARSH